MSCFAALFIYFIAGYDANNYNNNDRKVRKLDQPDVFYCGGSSNIQIPSKYVNDNYCDCMETGNDEPYTSACNNGKFFCEIDNKYIHSSLVNDGIICDCSDGSDEWALDSKCDKHHINSNNIQNDFNLFSQVINSVKHVYANILFPSYNAHIDNYENMKDVQQFLRKRRQNYQPNKRDNTDKYKPRLNNKELVDDGIGMEITSESSPSTLFFVILVVAASSALAMIGYIVKFRFLDKWKQGKQH